MLQLFWDRYHKKWAGWGILKTQEIFNKFLEEIQEQLSPTTYATWFKGLELVSMDDKTITIKVPLAVHKKILKLQYLDF